MKKNKYLDTLKLLERKGWTKGAYESEEGAHCVLGALFTAIPDSPEDYTARDVLNKLVQERTKKCITIVKFNDHPSTTFDDIWALLAEAAMLEDSK